MLSKIISLLIRGGVTFGIGLLVGIALHDGLDRDVIGEIPEITASIIWIVGGIYSLANFNNFFSVLKNVENKVSEAIDNKNKQKIEEKMLRVKKLLDSNILTEDEYNQKMKSLKEKYL